MTDMKIIKKVLTTFAFVLISFVTVVGCSKLEPQTNEYYIKYIFEAHNNSGYNYYRVCTISFTSEKEQVEMTFNKTNGLSYEVVTGPFKYNTKVYATLDGGGFPYTSIKILVSKNGSPFALKGIENGGRLEYTIDY